MSVRGHARTGMFPAAMNCIEGLETWGIIMLQHEVMAAHEGHNDRPRDHVTVCLCIHIVINKMHVCSLCIHLSGSRAPTDTDLTNAQQ